MALAGIAYEREDAKNPLGEALTETAKTMYSAAKDRQTRQEEEDKFLIDLFMKTAGANIPAGEKERAAYFQQLESQPDWGRFKAAFQRKGAGSLLQFDSSGRLSNILQDATQAASYAGPKNLEEYYIRNNQIDKAQALADSKAKADPYQTLLLKALLDSQGKAFEQSLEGASPEGQKKAATSKLVADALGAEYKDPEAEAQRLAEEHRAALESLVGRRSKLPSRYDQPV